MLCSCGSFDCEFNDGLGYIEQTPFETLKTPNQKLPVETPDKETPDKSKT